MANTVEKLRFRSCSKDYRPSEPSFNFGRGGRRTFVLRGTKIVLTEPAPIRGSNLRLRSRLARNCDASIFEFFNSIGRTEPLKRRPNTFNRSLADCWLTLVHLGTQPQSAPLTQIRLMAHCQHTLGPSQCALEVMLSVLTILGKPLHCRSHIASRQ